MHCPVNSKTFTTIPTPIHGDPWGGKLACTTSAPSTGPVFLTVTATQAAASHSACVCCASENLMARAWCHPGHDIEH